MRRRRDAPAPSCLSDREGRGVSERDCPRIVGDDPKPTGRLRTLMRPDGTPPGLKYEWRGEFGTIWIDAPIVRGELNYGD
jgi:hypothetical protein